MYIIGMNVYENVAWFGGSFSPPTNMHITVAIEIGKKLLSLTSANNRCCVSIVPVSAAYNKGSVNEECIPSSDRLKLAKAMLKAINQEFEDPRVDFVLETHEFDSPAPVATINSLEMLKEKYGNEATYYVAQGQDNIEAIIARKWNRSNNIINGYKFFMFPRGNSAIPPGIDHVLGKFTDAQSSSQVREKIQGSNTFPDLSKDLHPIVLEALRDIYNKKPVYVNKSICDPPKMKGGNKKFYQKTRRLAVNQRIRYKKRTRKVKKF